VLVGEASYAHSSAAVVLECEVVRAETAGDTVLSGMRYEVRRRRERFAQRGPVGIRKAPASAWIAGGAWEVEKRA
jgi:hypothetical protein